MNIEREARRIIRAEVEPFATHGVAVRFAQPRNSRVKVTIFRSDGSKAAPSFYFPTMSHSRDTVRTVAANARRALRDVGITGRVDKAPKKPPRIGTLGMAFRDEMRRAGLTEDDHLTMKRPRAAPGQGNLFPTPDDEQPDVSSDVVVREPELLCPDAIASRARPKPESTKMPAMEDASIATTITSSQHALNGHQEPAQEARTSGKANASRGLRPFYSKVPHRHTVEMTVLWERHGTRECKGGVYIYTYTDEGWNDQAVVDGLAKLGLETSLAKVIRTRQENYARLPIELMRRKKGNRPEAAVALQGHDAVTAKILSTLDAIASGLSATNARLTRLENDLGGVGGSGGQGGYQGQASGAPRPR